MAKTRGTRTQAVGLRDIAEELNVSVSLVSKVLSGRLGTSGAHIEKIRAIHDKARELDYRKNQLAEALRTGRQNVFAAFIHRHGAPGSSIVDDMVAGIAESAAGQGQRLMIHYYHNSEEFRKFSRTVHRNSVDGLIVAGLAHDELIDDLRAIHDRGVPILTLHDQVLDEQFPNVGMNQQLVVEKATQHLIERGCKRIGHFFVVEGRLPKARREGYRKAVHDAGLPYNPELIVEVPDFSYESGMSAVKKLIASGIEFDGIVGQSDQHAAGALNHLVSIGKRVPQDVKLIGIDNAPFCEFAMVPLSSMSQNFQARGQCAVEMLARKLAGDEVSSRQFDPILVARESSRQ